MRTPDSARPCAVLFAPAFFLIWHSATFGAHVALDAGHGGSDPGAVVGSIKESHLSLEITQQIKTHLTGMGHTVSLTRSRDQALTLEERAKTVNTIGGSTAQPDLLVSLHLNSSPDPRTSGFEIYLQNQLPLDEDALMTFGRGRTLTEGHGHDQLSEALELDRAERAMLVQSERARVSATLKSGKLSQQLASGQLTDIKAIVGDLLRNSTALASAELAKTLAREWRNSNPLKKPETAQKAASVRQAPFFLLTHVAVPSVLVEIAYLTHAKESQAVQQPPVQTQIAATIAAGIDKYLKSFASAD